jgi:uncharacterized protein YjbJ (UPF0337 family)
MATRVSRADEHTMRERPETRRYVAGLKLEPERPVFLRSRAGAVTPRQPKEVGVMAKSSHRDRSEGTLDRLRGRVTEMFGTLTGRKSRKAKGRTVRLRGRARTGRGRAKRAAR